MKKEFYFKISITLIALLLFIPNLAFAEEEPVPPSEDPVLVETPPLPPPPPEEEIQNILVTIQISDGENELDFPNTPVSNLETINIPDSSGENHSLNAKSVLLTLYLLDQMEESFLMTDLIYYPAWSALYLRCIVFQGEEKCDNWIYEVNGESPSVGMDNFILEDGDTVKVYFSSFWGDEEEPVDEEPEPEPAPEPKKSRNAGGGRWVEPIISEEPKTEQVKVVEEEIVVEETQIIPTPIKVATQEEKKKEDSKVVIENTDTINEPISPLNEENSLLANAGESAPKKLPYIPIVIVLSTGILVAISRN